MSIKVNNLSFSYNKKTPVLEDLSFEIESNELVGVMGISGCGKTTLLRILLGLNTPDTGSISIDGIEYKEENLNQIRSLISYIPQHGALYPHMKVYDNIFLPIKIKRTVTESDVKRAYELAEVCNIDPDLFKKFPNELSGGQKQRISILRALLMDTPYIFLDEPLSALDPITKVSIQKEFKNIFIQNTKTVIMITHALLEAKFLCDRLMIMNKGLVEQFDKTESVINNNQTGFVKEFIEAQV